MRRLAVSLWTGQLLAALAMLIAAAVSVESILVTGPLLSIVGLLLGSVTQPLRSWWTLLFALSAPLIAALISLVIAVFNLGPGLAQNPVVALMSIYLLFALPAAVVPFRIIRRWDVQSSVSRPTWQFSVKTLLLIMTGVCLLAAIGRLLIAASMDDEMLVFGGFTLGIIALCALLIGRFVAFRSVEECAPRPPDEFF